MKLYISELKYNPDNKSNPVAFNYDLKKCEFDYEKESDKYVLVRGFMKESYPKNSIKITEVRNIYKEYKVAENESTQDELVNIEKELRYEILKYIGTKKNNLVKILDEEIELFLTSITK